MSKSCYKSCNIEKRGNRMREEYIDKFWDTPYIRTYVNMYGVWNTDLTKRVLDIRRASEKSSLGPVLSAIITVENTGNHPDYDLPLNNRAQGATLTRGEIESDCVAVVLTRIRKRDAEMRRLLPSRERSSPLVASGSALVCVRVCMCKLNSFVARRVLSCIIYDYWLTDVRNLLKLQYTYWHFYDFYREEKRRSAQKHNDHCV